MKAIRKARITDAGNTYQYANTIIHRKGYKVFFIPDLKDEYGGVLWAIKEGRDFIAEDSLKLLALINIWEEFGDEWYTKPKYKLKEYDTIYYYSTVEFETVEDLENLPQNEFEDLVESFQMLFNTLALDLKIPRNISPRKLFHLMDNYYKVGEKISLTMDWVALNTSERVKFFRKFIEDIFYLTEDYFKIKVEVLYFEHDYAALDDEYHVWWIDTRIEWENQTHNFRISYDYAQSEQMLIPELITNLNNIFKNSAFQYAYLEAGNKYLIYLEEKEVGFL